MPHVELMFRIQAKSALHIGTGLGLAGIVDKRIARRLHEKDSRLVYIPGSSVKGRLRWHFMQLARNLLGDNATCKPDQRCRSQPCPCCHLFGSEAIEGQLVFHDAALTQDWQNLASEAVTGRRLDLAEFFATEYRANASISRRRGVAMEQRLFASEVAASELEFDARVDGRVTGVLPSSEINGTDIPAELFLLIAAARTVTHIGGGKSRGLGRCAITAQAITVDGKGLREDQLFSALNADVIRGWQDALARRGTN